MRLGAQTSQPTITELESEHMSDQDRANTERPIWSVNAENSEQAPQADEGNVAEADAAVHQDENGPPLHIAIPSEILGFLLAILIIFYRGMLAVHPEGQIVWVKPPW